jgi:23S rRNA (uridine2552-2'-O)-methyltransferase
MPKIAKRTKTKVKTAKGRKLSSTRWLQRHLNDPYVAQAHIDQYRSRAAYKLLEIDTKYSILKKNSVVIDLGAAPGSWSQIIASKASKVIAVDLLNIKPMPGVDIIEGDFTLPEIRKEIDVLLDGQKVDTILSDMSPNISGNKALDHLRIMNLADIIKDFASIYLKKGGTMVIKVFQGSVLEEFVKQIKEEFAAQIKYFKPESSRKESAEIYLIILVP